MNWNAAIEQHSETLKRIVVTLFAMAGLGDVTFPQDSAPAQKLAERSSLPRHLHLAILRLLRPAEAAARRLIIALARELLHIAQQALPIAATPLPGNRAGVLTPQTPDHRPAALTLPLLDPLRQPFRCRPVATSGVPRICVPGYTEPAPIAPRLTPRPGDLIDATRLGRRLTALSAVLDDLPRHARRFARWHRDAAGAQNGDHRDAAGAQNRDHRDAAGAPNKRPRARRLWPLRPGRPPGSRRRQRHEVHDLLDVTHGLAFWALERPRRDTS